MVSYRPSLRSQMFLDIAEVRASPQGCRSCSQWKAGFFVNDCTASDRFRNSSQ